MNAPVYRTLTCQQCGQEFQRLAQRGQPPKRCPDCRPTATAPSSPVQHEPAQDTQ